MIKLSAFADEADTVLEGQIKALKDNNYEPIIEPKVDLKNIDENGCTFVFTITTKPSVNIKKYKGLKVKKDEVSVSKEEIDAEVDNMLKRYSELVVKDYGVVENGVTVQKEDPFFTNPGIVLIFGALWLTNLGYWGFNQYIIQRQV